MFATHRRPLYVHRLLMAFALGLCIGCARGPTELVTRANLARLAAPAPQQLLLVNLEYAVEGQTQPRLTARVVAGSAPFLRDRDGLGGHLQILTRGGKVLWEMNYVPSALGGYGFAQSITLRAPLPAGADRVHLVEEQRGLDLTAPVEHRKASY